MAPTTPLPRHILILLCFPRDGDARRLGALGLDARAARVERLDGQTMHAEFEKDADEDEEGNRYPKLGRGELRQHGGPQRLSTVSTALATAGSAGAPPGGGAGAAG